VIETPTITDSPEQMTAYISLVVNCNEIKTVMGPAIGEVYAALQAQAITPTGPWFTHHRRRPTDTFDFDACVPVSKPVKPTGRVKPGTLPAAKVVRTLYQGNYDGLAGAWGEFSAWIKTNGHTPREDLWECYLVGPVSSNNPADWKTELNCPLVAAGAKTASSNPDSAVTTERVFSATPRQVFAAFEQPDRLAKWWGPKDFTNTFDQFEFKPGGRWVFTMHGPNGANYANESIFQEIQPDKIVIEHVLPPWFMLTVTLTPSGNQTHLSWVQEFESPEVAAKFRPLSKTANEQNLDRLQAVLDDCGR